jgi:hypothetical protein
MIRQCVPKLEVLRMFDEALVRVIEIQLWEDWYPLNQRGIVPETEVEATTYDRKLTLDGCVRDTTLATLNNVGSHRAVAEIRDRQRTDSGNNVLLRSGPEIVQTTFPRELIVFDDQLD